VHAQAKALHLVFYPNYRLWDTVNAPKKRSQQLHEQRFPGEENKAMCPMLTEWRRDIRYKTALLCLDCAGWRPESGMKGSWLHAK